QPDDYRIDVGAMRCLKPALPAVRGGAIGCYNSAAADRHAHEEGILAGREMYLEALQAEVLGRLDDGQSICIGAVSYTLGEILSEGLVSAPDLRLWADSVALDTEAARKAFRKRAYEIVEDWVKAHIDDIAMVE